MMDKSWIWDFDVLPFYLAIHEEFLRQYLVPSRGAVWGTYSVISILLDCHLVEGVWYIYMIGMILDRRY